MHVVINNIYFKTKMALHKFFRDEQGDVNVVSLVVLIGVAVLLAIIFKDAITTLIESMLGTITENAQNAVGGDAGGAGGAGEQ